MTASYRLVYPYDLPPNRGSLHWRVRYEQRKKAARVFGELLPRLRATTHATVQWTRVLGPRQKEMDESNFCMLTKGIEDALTQGGYIVDDSPTWIARQPHVDDPTRRDLGPRIEVTILYDDPHQTMIPVRGREERRWPARTP